MNLQETREGLLRELGGWECGGGRNDVIKLQSQN